MLFEAIEVIGKLFSGKVVKHDGEYFTLESARLYTHPEQPVPIYVATAGPSTPSAPAASPTGSSPSAPPTRRSTMLWGKFREGAAEAGKDPGHANAAPGPRLLGARRRPRPRPTR